MITMKPVRLVNTTEGHRKFWAVEVVGRKALCSWGRIGTWIQSKEFQFDSADAAIDFACKKAQSKLGKGYRWAPQA